MSRTPWARPATSPRLPLATAPRPTARSRRSAGRPGPRARGPHVDTTLGAVQLAARGGRRIPIHGGLGGEEGIANFVNYAPNDTTLEPDPPVGKPVAGSRYLTPGGYP